MSLLSFSKQSHSADVLAFLVVNGRRIPLSKVGPGRIYFQVPEQLPEVSGRIELSVDGEIRSWDVKLPNGSVPFACGVETERV